MKKETEFMFLDIYLNVLMTIKNLEKNVCRIRNVLLLATKRTKHQAILSYSLENAY